MSQSDTGGDGMKIEMEFQGLAELVKAFEKAASDDEIKADRKSVV